MLKVKGCAQDRAGCVGHICPACSTSMCWHMWHQCVINPCTPSTPPKQHTRVHHLLAKQSHIDRHMDAHNKQPD